MVVLSWTQWIMRRVEFAEIGLPRIMDVMVVDNHWAVEQLAKHLAGRLSKRCKSVN